MKSKVKKLNSVLKEKAIIESQRYILFSNCFATVTNGLASLKIPFEIEQFNGNDICVQGKRFIKAIEACNNPEIKVTDKNIIVSDGSFKVCVPLINPDDFVVSLSQDFTTNSIECNRNFLKDLQRLKPFIGKNSDTFDILCINKNHMWASNGYSCGMVTYESNIIDAQVVLPADALEYIIKYGENPESIYYDDRYFAMIYEDGSLLVVQQSEKAAPNAPGLFEKAKTDDVYPISEELLKDVKRLACFTDDEHSAIKIYNGELISGVEPTQAKATGYDSLHDVNFKAADLVMCMESCSKMRLKVLDSMSYFQSEFGEFEVISTHMK